MQSAEKESAMRVHLRVCSRDLSFLHVAARCSALQCVVECRECTLVISLACMLQCVAVCCSVLQCVAMCCSVLWVYSCDLSFLHVAVCCSVLPCVAVCFSVLRVYSSDLSFSHARAARAPIRVDSCSHCRFSLRPLSF